MKSSPLVVFFSGGLLLLLSLLINGADALYERTLVVEDCVQNPDGYPLLGICVKDLKDTVPLVVDGNGVPGNDTLPTVYSLPGPEIRVKSGERVRITVINKLHSASTSIHWHGLHQKGTQWADGVPSITQCPILPNDHYTYDFVAAQGPGTFFYHSHSSNQYGAGLTGAFIIEADELENDPIYETYAYARDHVMFLMDWAHEPYADLEMKYVGRIGSAKNFKPDYAMWPNQAININGKGQYTCGQPVWNGTAQNTIFLQQSHCDVVNKHGWQYLQTGTGFKPYEPGTLGGAGQCQPQTGSYLGECVPPEESDASTFECPAGESVRMRIINSAAGLPMAVWVDRHNLTVVARDGLNVEPAEVNVVLIAVGARIDVILNCDQSGSVNYKMFASFSEAFYPGSASRLPNCWNPDDFPTPPPGASNAYAILKYTDGNGDATATETVAPEVSVYDMQTKYREHYKGMGNSKQYLPMFFTSGLKSKPDVTAPAAVERLQVNMKSHGNYPGYWKGQCSEAPEGPDDGCSYQGMRMEWWSMNGYSKSHDSAQLPVPTPVLLNNYLGLDESVYPGYQLNLEYDAENPKVYEIVIVNYEPQNHPMHAHGNSMYIVGYGYWTTNSTDDGWKYSTYQTNWWADHQDANGDFVYVPSQHGLPELGEEAQNVGMGDTWTIPPRGFVVLRIIADNPGAWYMHCHMEYHLVADMALVLNIAEKSTASMALTSPPEDYAVCGSVGKYAEVEKAKEDKSLDSGVIAGLFIGGFVGASVMFASGFVLGRKAHPAAVVKEANSGDGAAGDVEMTAVVAQ